MAHECIEPIFGVAALRLPYTLFVVMRFRFFKMRITFPLPH